MLVNMTEMLNKARKERYGVVAPNINNEVTARAAIECAQELRAPVILDLIYDMNPDIPLLLKMVREMGAQARIPVAINLDHSNTYEKAMIGLKAGYTSIMVDRSSAPFETNIAEVAELVKAAHALNVSVEAELGHVGSGAQYEQDRNAGLTDPKKAREFVERTKVDALAIAIGTAHGTYHGTPYLDFELLREIKAAVSVPLVLHGGSGTGDENLAKAAREGIAKVNIGTDLFKAGNEALAEGYRSCRRPNESFALYAAGYQKQLAHYITLLGSKGKADE